MPKENIIVFISILFARTNVSGKIL